MKSEGDCFLGGTPWQTQTMCWKSDTTLPTKIYIVKAVVFPVVMYSCELDNKEGRAPKNGCLQTVVLEKTPESVLDSMEIKPVSFKGNQPWILVRRTDAEDEAPVFWSSDTNRQLTGKVPDAGKDWGQKEKRVSEDEMAGWHHWCNGHETGQTSGDGEERGGLVCCSPWGRRESDTAGWLKNNKPSVSQEDLYCIQNSLSVQGVTNHVFSKPTHG